MALDATQWAAMAATVAAAWLVAAQHKRRRQIGFWVYLASNVLWVIWGLHDHAWALIVLQFCLAGLNLRGIRKNDPPADDAERSEAIDANRRSGTER